MFCPFLLSFLGMILWTVLMQEEHICGKNPFISTNKLESNTRTYKWNKEIRISVELDFPGI